MEKYSVYSLADVVMTMNNPDVGMCVVSDEGGGRIVISRTGDLSSHTIFCQSISNLCSVFYPDD